MRLTKKRADNGRYYLSGLAEVSNIYPKGYGRIQVGHAVDKLAEYEDLEEQNRMLKLPCAVGDTVYVIEVDEENFTHFHCPRKISEYKFNLQMLDLLGIFGRCIFLTKEEAEKVLKEL